MASKGTNQHMSVIPFREAYARGLSHHPKAKLVYRRGHAHIQVPSDAVSKTAPGPVTRTWSIGG